MNVDTSYVHALDGRLRIKIPKVKGAAGQAQEVERHLGSLPGLRRSPPIPPPETS